MKFTKKILASLLVTIFTLTGLGFTDVPEVTIHNTNIVQTCYARTKTSKKNVKRKTYKRSTSLKRTTVKKSKVQNDYVVYTTKIGHKYHRSGCRYLKRSCYKSTLSSARANGFTPCSVCNP